MDQEPARAFPDPWHDPDFSPRQVVGRKSERGSPSGGSWNDQGEDSGPGGFGCGSGSFCWSCSPSGWGFFSTRWSAR